MTLVHYHGTGVLTCFKYNISRYMPPMIASVILLFSLFTLLRKGDCVTKHVSNLSNPTKQMWQLTTKFHFSTRHHHEALQEVLSESDNIWHKCSKLITMREPFVSLLLDITYYFAKLSIRYSNNRKNTDRVLHGFWFRQGFSPHHLLHSFWKLQLCTVFWYLLCLIKISKTLVKSWQFLNYLF